MQDLALITIRIYIYFFNWDSLHASIINLLQIRVLEHLLFLFRQNINIYCLFTLFNRIIILFRNFLQLHWCGKQLKALMSFILSF